MQSSADLGQTMLFVLMICFCSAIRQSNSSLSKKCVRVESFSFCVYRYSKSFL